MINRLLALVVVLAVFLCLLTSCGASTQEEDPFVQKLRTIEADWTEQQVYDLLGEPDRYGERSVVAEVFYDVDDATVATIQFWSEGIDIILYNQESGERTVILESSYAY